jgi:CheY-like chemotaxis protein
MEVHEPEGHSPRCDLLVAEDEENFRWLIGEAIHEALPDMRVEFAEDGCEALAKVKALRPRIVWTCLKMPRMNGLDLIEAIRNNSDLKETKIIVWTGYGSGGAKKKAIESGADVFMSKGDTCERFESHLLSAIAKCLLWLAVPSSYRPGGRPTLVQKNSLRCGAAKVGDEQTGPGPDPEKEEAVEKEKVRFDGEGISLDECEKVFAKLMEHPRDKREIFRALYGFVVECSKADDVVTAYAYAEKMLLYADNAGQKAYCLLFMGQFQERVGDLGEALKIYLSAMDLPPERNDDWYFLCNNLGYCLNWFGRHAEAAPFCRAAIEINPKRHNAYKNLGVALQGQGEFSKAADAYIEATRICPRDGRALNLLEELVSHEKERILDIGDVIAEMKKCRELVERATLN